MSVDPELQAVLDLVAAAGEVDPRAVGPEGLRAGFEALSVLFGPVRDDVEVTEMTLQGRSGPITACRFEPAGGGDGSALIWFHGGGWVIGSVDTHASLCADLAVAAGTSVISVDYRLAPEHPFPAALDDALDATLAVVTDAGSSGVDPGRVAVGGDSAGGQLATVVARRFRDLGGPSLAAQVLVYPVTDLAAAPGEHPSQQESASGYLLTGATMDFFADCYAPVVENRGDPDLSPLRAPCSPPSTTCCATRERPTRGRCAQPGSTSSPSATPGRSTCSCSWPAPLRGLGRWPRSGRSWPARAATRRRNDRLR